MTTWLITHEAGLGHDTGPGHPECPARLEAVLKALEGPAFAALQRHEAEAATPDELRRVHDAAYIEETLAAIPEIGYRHLDGDTVVCPGSAEAALRAAGAVRQAVDAVMGGAARRAFCAVRPPGHHAEPDRAMGFCLFNNIAVGALHARIAHGVQRVAVVDFDVHHGNGTQAMLGGREGFLYVSTHQHPLFPGTGTRRENRPGNLLNIPMPGGTDSAAYREQFHGQVISALMEFDPELLLISAGFDADAHDPLAGMNLDTDDFAWITEELVAVADYCCGGRVVSSLEGGYNLGALGRGVAAHVSGLLR
ncbi:histone deacetylase family protein [Sediminicurvatus halobius]|uniref:Acetoin utilization protein n=1 Tax=Sediminicurvatus halobius TaxID=2182432 RepID=A0A2U2MYV1_9GAMM|nr:histone deacetylase family protein [Spiribacter halobius]PWG61973.1 acetoin utilization protein [Spiribacter halobius]UEX78379.1 histone deacetylase family protein [Spiribacter halobius]